MRDPHEEVLGVTFVDRYTLFEGVCTAVCHYIDGTDQVQLETFCADRSSQKHETKWFELGRLDPKPISSSGDFTTTQRGQ